MNKETSILEIWSELVRRRSSFRFAATLLITLLSFSPQTAQANDKDCTALEVGRERARICRDDFGRPRIFARTNRGLFEAYGYIVAQDRLWQLELNRRAPRGRLAEILGPSALPSDIRERTEGYTDEELDAQFATLNAEEQEVFTAYVEGINRYRAEVVAPDPEHKLPFEFHQLGIGVPALWTVRDAVAFTVRTAGALAPMARRRELDNQSLLASLRKTHGSEAGLAIFNDVRWINDPDAPVSIPVEEVSDKPREPPTSSPARPAQLQGASAEPRASRDEEAEAIWRSLGIPSTLGSHGWVVSADKSANGSAMLFGGPQQGFSTPEINHEVQLTGGNGFHVTGIAYAGIPLVIIGRTDHIAWTTTAGLAADTVDFYIETLCERGSGYTFNGVCIPFDSRDEVIKVRDAGSVTLTVQRTIHGPVVESGAPGSGVVFTQKRVFWQRELEDFRAWLAFNRARNLDQFQQAVTRLVNAYNLLYADQRGDIAYWLAGQIPLRPSGFDRRLPLPGDGSAEWPGGLLAIPTSINPSRGWLANWNDKPSVHYDNPDSQIFGKQSRLREIEERLATGLISREDMRDIARDIARTGQGSVGRGARFLKPYLLDALNVIPPSHPLASQARTVLENWEGSRFTDAVTSTNLQPGQVIFGAWMSRMLALTFADELGDGLGEASLNMLLHVLDDALGGGSGVPPSRDYFNGADPNAVISAAFDQALTALGPDPVVWSAQPRGNITFAHPIVGPVGTIPESNRANYAQIVVLSRPRASAENILTLGQSGFIQLVPPDVPVLDPHFRDQLELLRNFEYKPMPLARRPES